LSLGGILVLREVQLCANGCTACRFAFPDLTQLCRSGQSGPSLRRLLGPGGCHSRLNPSWKAATSRKPSAESPSESAVTSAEPEYDVCQDASGRRHGKGNDDLLCHLCRWKLILPPRHKSLHILTREAPQFWRSQLTCKLLQRVPESFWLRVGQELILPRWTNLWTRGNRPVVAKKPRMIGILCLLTQISPVRIDGVGP
jgi:hypothetical protein